MFLSHHLQCDTHQTKLKSECKKTKHSKHAKHLCVSAENIKTIGSTVHYLELRTFKASRDIIVL